MVALFNVAFSLQGSTKHISEEAAFMHWDEFLHHSRILPVVCTCAPYIYTSICQHVMRHMNSLGKPWGLLHSVIWFHNQPSNHFDMHGATQYTWCIPVCMCTCMVTVASDIHVQLFESTLFDTVHFKLTASPLDTALFDNAVSYTVPFQPLHYRAVYQPLQPSLISSACCNRFSNSTLFSTIFLNTTLHNSALLNSLQ